MTPSTNSGDLSVFEGCYPQSFIGPLPPGGSYCPDIPLYDPSLPVAPGSGINTSTLLIAGGVLLLVLLLRGRR